MAFVGCQSLGRGEIVFTLFTIPKAFRGHIGAIQRNAINSWTLLRPKPEVIIFGDDEGSEEAARDCDVLYAPSVARNEFGTPLLSDLFEKAEKQASHSVLCYVNADILLMQDFGLAVQVVRDSLQRFLMVGRRWDVEIRDALNLATPDWQTSIRSLALGTNQQRPQEWVDYFVFTRGLGRALPPFAVGRTCWDNWLIWHARTEGASVVDASDAVLAVHQNHDYSHHPQGEDGAWRGLEAKENLRLSGGRMHHHTINNATHCLTPSAKIQKVPLRRYISASLAPLSSILFDMCVHRTVSARHRIGLRRSKRQRV
jgi:hypothetical protein